MTHNNDKRCFWLSPQKKKNLIPIVKKRLLAGTVLNFFWPVALFFCPVTSLAATEAEIQINEVIEKSLNEYFSTLDSNDWSFTVNLPTVSFNCQTYQIQWRDTPQPGTNTAKLICPNTPLQAYISVDIARYQDVVVAATSLTRGDPLASADMVVKRMNIGQLRLGYFNKRQEITGWQVQRTVKAGQVLTPYIVKAPLAVKRGDWVQILAGNEKLQVTMMGEALRDGSIGEQIPVRNLSSDKRIKAWILHKGVVSTVRRDI